MSTITIIVNDDDTQVPNLTERLLIMESNVERLTREVQETKDQSLAVIAALTGFASQVSVLQAQVAEMLANGASAAQLQNLADGLDAAQQGVAGALNPPAPAPEAPSTDTPQANG